MQDAQRIPQAEAHVSPSDRPGGTGAANARPERPPQRTAPQFVDPWRGC